MATYKAEFLSHHYARRIRPAAHYSMGWLPVWSAIAAPRPGRVNRIAHAPGSELGWPRRSPASTPAGTSRGSPTRRCSSGSPAPDASGAATAAAATVLLWPDTFTNHFHPSVGRAAVEVIEAAGWRVTMPERRLCCGLTWISTGQLQTAKRVLRRTVGSARRPRPRRRARRRARAELHRRVPQRRRRAVPRRPRRRAPPRARPSRSPNCCTTTRPGWEPPRARTPGRRADPLPPPRDHGRSTPTRRSSQRPAPTSTSSTRVAAGSPATSASSADTTTSRLRAPSGCCCPRCATADDRDVILADGFSCRTQIHQGDSGWPRGDASRRAASGRPATPSDPTRSDRPSASGHREPDPGHGTDATSRPCASEEASDGSRSATPVGSIAEGWIPPPSTGPEPADAQPRDRVHPQHR